MGIRLNREIKAYCPDFKPVRSVLRGLEAAFIEVKHQTDFFLPPAARRKQSLAQGGSSSVSRKEKRHQVIYYCERQNGQFQMELMHRKFQPGHFKSEREPDTVEDVLPTMVECAGACTGLKEIPEVRRLLRPTRCCL